MFDFYPGLPHMNCTKMQQIRVFLAPFPGPFPLNRTVNKGKLGKGLRTRLSYSHNICGLGHSGSQPFVYCLMLIFLG